MRATAAHGLLLALGCACSAAGLAQEGDPRRSTTIADLPRPGYEPRVLTVGGFAIAPRIDLKATYNDNIFATPEFRDEDVVASIRPSATARRTTGTSDLRLEANADLIRYARATRENVATFRAAADWRRDVNRRQAWRARASFDRTFQRRSDPEADFGRDRPPTLIDVAEAAVDYNHAGPRFGLLASAGFSRFDYRPRADADRDFDTYRASLRGSYAVATRTTAFVQGYALRRNARLPVDRFGVDRDTTTLGALAGASFDLTARLQGELGIGAFRADPADPTLPPFSGIAVSGQLTWQPRVRTAVTLDAFRGDVATIRAGAIGRVDTRVALAVERELRHDWLLRLGAGIRDIGYRGAPDQDQRFRFADVEATHLVDRRVELVGSASYTRRDADRPENRFRRWMLTLGLRLAY